MNSHVRNALIQDPRNAQEEDPDVEDDERHLHGLESFDMHRGRCLEDQQKSKQTRAQVSRSRKEGEREKTAYESIHACEGNDEGTAFDAHDTGYDVKSCVR